MCTAMIDQQCRRHNPQARPPSGVPLPEMPLFLSPDRYINVPLAATSQVAYRGVASFWREVLEGRRPVND